MSKPCRPTKRAAAKDPSKTTRADLAAEVARLQARLARLERDSGRPRAAVGAGRELDIVRYVAEHLPFYLAWKDRDLVYLGCNLNQARAVGLDDPADIAGKTDYDLPWTKAEADLYRAGDRQVIETGEPLINREATQHRADGTVMNIVTSKVPLRNADGQIIGVISLFADITERKHAEAALEAAREELERRVEERTAALADSEARATEAHARLLEAMESFPDGVGLYDADDRLVLFNRQFREGILSGIRDLIEPGVTYEALVRAAVDRQLVDIPDGDAEGYVRDRLAHHRRGEGSLEVKVAGGRWMLARERRTRDGGIIGIRSDITESKQREEALRQAQKMEAVGQLTGGVAHDFNNLLMVIQGSLELIAERSTEQGDIADFVGTALRATRRGADLAHRLLAFSRRQALAPRSVDLNGLVSGMCDLVRRTLGEGIEIRTRRAGDLWACEVDPSQMENALLNLAINARDAMPAGGQLTIETANARFDGADAAADADLVPGDYVRLSVADTGEGMPPDVAERAFEPFFTTKDVGEGSGLGLSMVHGFVKQSDGQVHISS